MIVTPVNWYQAPSSLKLMIDRLVCADGGNPDPTSTSGKDAEESQRSSNCRAGPIRAISPAACSRWSCTATPPGAENLRRILTDWLEDMGLIPAGHLSHVDRYVGYYEPYATSHDDLDKDESVQEDVRNAARALMQAVKDRRSGKLEPPDRGLKEPEPK